MGWLHAHACIKVHIIRQIIEVFYLERQTWSMRDGREKDRRWRKFLKKILNNCNPLSLIPRHWPKSLENESSCNYTNAGPFPSLSCTFFLNHEDFHACELESWIPTFLNFPPEKSSQNFQQSGEVGINFLIWSFRILPSHFLSLLLII